jgi:hypothetical protein
MKVGFILDEFGCMELVQGKEKKPEEPSASATASERAGYMEKVDSWTKRYKKACSIIVASCTSSVLVYLEGVLDPVEMWKALEDKFAPKTATTRFQHEGIHGIEGGWVRCGSAPPTA